MDLRRYANVLWRFRVLVVLGFMLALTLGLLSVVKVSSHGLTYRQARLWQSTVRLLVTQRGFPEGRLYAQEQTPPGQTPTTPPATTTGVTVADPARFNNLAILYAKLIVSDPVRRIARYNGLEGTLTALPLRDEQSGTLLPLIDVMAISTTAQGAIAYADRSARALNRYISDQQRVNHVPLADRAIVKPIDTPHGANVFRSRPKTMPIVVFLAVMFATVGLAFLLENARPPKREHGETDPSRVKRDELQPQRRSA